MLQQMMSTPLIRRCIFASALLALLVLPTQVAQAQDYSFDDFRVGIVVNEDGSMNVTEQIRVQFWAERHGIFREIPVKYDGRFGSRVSIDLEVISVTDDTGKEWNYETYKEGNNQVIKIGDADTLIYGTQEYNIKYRVDRALLFFDDHDELYWNVTGTDWGVTIPRSSVAIQLPESIKSGVQVICFTGSYGATTEGCDKAAIGNLVTVSAEDNLTVAVSFPKGHVQEPAVWEIIFWFLIMNWIICVPLVVGAVLLWYWWKHGRDESGRKTIIPEYDAPKDLGPMEMGTLVDGKVHPRDISSGVVSLAVKGYLKIKEEEKKKLVGKKTEFSFEKLKPADDKLSSIEKELFSGIFGKKDQVDLDDLKTSFYKTKNEIQRQLYKEMATKKYFVKNPNTVRTTFLVIGLVCIFGSFMTGVFGLPFVASMILTGVLFIGFGVIMPKKTKSGTLAYEHAKGFKMFLEKAERYRIQWQERQNMFEEYLPYAMVFGVADKWVKAFSDKLSQSPDWYEGNVSTFNAATFASSLNSFTNNMNTTTRPPSSGASGGSSGFSGGFSGGGFGGGGGGSW